MMAQISNSLHRRAYEHHEYHGYQWYLMALVAGVLLTLCFLLAGLTLGVCGLDIKWLQMRTITGTAKQSKQALVILRLKRNGSWMLCSLIICSVACTEYFPFVINDLIGVTGKWVPIIVSTALIAVFAEIIPQWLIPQNAVSWGYYFSTLIWACMWITAVVSYPLAWILDGLAWRHRDELGTFNNRQLGLIIKHHDHSEKKGGELSSEATRIMLGVLSNDGRDIGGDISDIPRPGSGDTDMDVEKADIAFSRGLIVKWSAVKTVDINEVVNQAFIDKVVSWSYSRIPVIGKPDQHKSTKCTRTVLPWGNTQVFGFLHVKHLIGLNLTTMAPSSTFVRDLLLYPLPIITQETSVFDALHMFQLGMSRMALVVPGDSCLGGTLQGPGSAGAVWTGTQRTRSKIATKMEGLKRSAGRLHNYIPTASNDSFTFAPNTQGIIGVRIPKPIGIITFEDIIDSVLQRTSHDEKDFFERNTDFPPTKSRKSGDPRPPLLNIRHHTTIRGSDIILSTIKKSNVANLRKRNITARIELAGLDGAQDNDSSSASTLANNQHASNMSNRSMPDDGPEILEPRKIRKLQKAAPSSSYTQNSAGGFHEHEDTQQNEFKNAGIVADDGMAPKPLPKGITQQQEGIHSQPMSFESATLPSRTTNILMSVQGDMLEKSTRSFSAAPRLIYSSTASPFSRQDFSSFEDNTDDHSVYVEESSLPGLDSKNTPYYGIDEASMDYFTYGTLLGQLYNTTSVVGSTTDPINSDVKRIKPREGQISCPTGTTKPHKSSKLRCKIPSRKTSSSTLRTTRSYDGFPPELLNSNKENRSPSYLSKTLPRTIHLQQSSSTDSSSEYNHLCNENRLQDDRSLLPSQRIFNKSLFSEGNRSSSMWF